MTSREPRAASPPGPSPSAPLPLSAPVYVPVTVVAELLGVSRQAAAKRCMAEGWAHRYASGAGGGRRLEVAIASLPDAAQAAYRQRQGLGAGGWGLGEGREGSAERRAPSAEGIAPSGNGRDAQTGLSVAEIRESARESDRAIEAERLAVLEALETYCQARAIGRNRVKTIREFLTVWNAGRPDRQVSKSTLYEWIGRKRQCGHLLPGYAVGPRGQDIPPEILERFQALYMTQNKLTITVCRQLILGELVQAGSGIANTLPSVASFRRYVHTIPAQARILARDGSDAYRRRCQPYLSRDYSEYRVMERWVADHYNHKMWVYHEGRVFRPWLTQWLDVRSRCGMGSFQGEGPSVETVLAALADGVLRYGAPEILWSDNGLEFSSPSVAGKSRRWRVRPDRPRVTALVEHLGATWHFSLPKEPQSRGIIERWFGVMLERFDKLFASYCGRDITEKPDTVDALLKTPRALPTLGEFRRRFRMFVEEVMNETPSEGQGMDGRSPREVFEAEPYTRRTASREALKLLFTRSPKWVQVGQNGIHVFDRDYGGIELAPHFGQRVYYRFDPADLGELYVFSCPDEQYLCTVQRPDASRVSEAEYRRLAQEKKALRKMATAYQVKREAAAATPDPVAALAAARKFENDRRRAGEVQAVEPRASAEPQKIVRVATALEFAARRVKADRKARVRREAARVEAGETLMDLGGGLTGKRKPTQEELADAAFGELVS